MMGECSICHQEIKDDKNPSSICEDCERIVWEFENGK